VTKPRVFVWRVTFNADKFMTSDTHAYGEAIACDVDEQSQRVRAGQTQFIRLPLPEKCPRGYQDVSVSSWALWNDRRREQHRGESQWV
jgi:hypothetical protein